MKKNIACAFTGHRIIKVTEELKLKIKSEIIKLIENGVAVFLNGGAIGFDVLCANEIIKLKKTYPIKLKMILPCKDQSAKWNFDQKLAYDEILYNADEVLYISENYVDGCMQKRNRMLIEECDYLIAYCHKEMSGSYTTMKQALKEGKTVINLFD